ncbi:MAG: hypothetical protein J6Y57_11935 [Lachnospiraceae bacterium]|nr:hypothetical protein [Lachnospiraceae bacterium]
MADYTEELNALEILEGEERLKRVEGVFRDKNKAAEVIPLLYLRDVADIAKLYEGQGVHTDDLIGEGNVALLTGTQSLDLCESAAEVEEFLTRTVMDAMEALIDRQGKEVQLDEQIAERVNRIYEEAKELSETLLRKVSVQELAQEMDVDVSTIEEAIRLSGDRIDYIDAAIE